MNDVNLIKDNRRAPLGLYIHIPFCVRKCSYCDFLSAPSAPKTRQRYAAALCREIQTASNLKTCFRAPGNPSQAGGNSEAEADAFPGSAKPPVDTVFIGGGTPTTLDPEDLAAIMECVHSHFDVLPDAEITMEMNPGTFSEEMLAFVCKYLNRVSIGLQSARDEELGRLGRIHTYEDFRKCYYRLREAGISNVNVDLMSGIPGQTVQSWRETLDKVTALNPEHISAYSLIIEEGTPFYDLYKSGDLDLPNEDAEREMYHLTGRLLAETGFRRYEISNYAKPGYACRHNIRYWRRRPYLGFGIGSATLYGEPAADGLLRIFRKEKQQAAAVRGESPEIFSGQYRRTNSPNLKSYLDYYGQPGYCSQANTSCWDQSAYLAECVTERLTVKDAVEEFMFLGLRMTNGISQKDFLDAFGLPFSELYGRTVRELSERGLLAESGDRVYLTERGLDVANVVMAEFLL